MITQEELKNELLYDECTGVFTRNKKTRGKKSNVGNVAGCLDKDGYIRIKVLGKPYQAHRLAWLYIYGSFPEKYIDHINGQRNDNRISNLRDVDMATNIQNLKKSMSSNKTSGFLGVCFDKRRCLFTAQIQNRGKKIVIGYYQTAQEAHQAYLIKKREIHQGCTI